MFVVYIFFYRDWVNHVSRMFGERNKKHGKLYKLRGSMNHKGVLINNTV